ncbi:hypothetical protein [Terribacillus saccharophilus]|uniref:hypothetical protein n=1 Tax=Terribacillus saccharophilus TaxID=361277 RepID=UPI002DC35586|nr:hypothetical protein [Terribacillus saccharophilus]MEC0288794.1 hypothetical protein [Terribacillus saccharophilus]
MSTKKVTPPNSNPKEMHCGIVMPISNHADYPKGHWHEVLNIIKEVLDEIDDYQFKTDLVSESDGVVTPIHNSIVNNLYDADIVICDISSSNPNVFFELGMRLTFDKPVIIIKDDISKSPFDTTIIPYIEYSAALRYVNIQELKSNLTKSLLATLHKKDEDPNYSPFLIHFRDIKYKPSEEMSEKEIEMPSYAKIIMDRLDTIELRQKTKINPVREGSAVREREYEKLRLRQFLNHLIEKYKDSILSGDYKYENLETAAFVFVGENPNHLTKNDVYNEINYAFNKGTKS